MYVCVYVCVCVYVYMFVCVCRLVVNTVGFAIPDRVHKQQQVFMHRHRVALNGDATRDHCLVETTRISICDKRIQGQRTLLNAVQLGVVFIIFACLIHVHRTAQMQCRQLSSLFLVSASSCCFPCSAPLLPALALSGVQAPCTYGTSMKA